MAKSNASAKAQAKAPVTQDTNQDVVDLQTKLIRCEASASRIQVFGAGTDFTPHACTRSLNNRLLDTGVWASMCICTHICNIM